MRLFYFDDSGKRVANETAPFFVLGGFGIDSERVPELAEVVRDTATKYQFQLGYPAELKFQHVGTQGDSERKPQWMLRAGLSDIIQRRALVYSCLRAATSVPSVEVICVGVNVGRLGEGDNVIEKALTPLLERVELNSKRHATHSIVMMDEERKDDQLLRDSLRNGSPFFPYKSLIDSIAFMPSQDSPGIQIADLIAGGFQRYLNANDSGYLRTFLKAVDGYPNDVSGRGLKLLHGRDHLEAPQRRSGPWSPTDRAIHEAEFAALMPHVRLTWVSDGTPNKIFTRDWDTPEA